MKTRPNRLAILAVGITAMTLSGFAQAGGEGWIRDDYDTALKTAVEKDMPILIDFTGSDWCPPCKQLNAEVFSQSLFMEEAGKKFVLLELDYPRGGNQTDEVKEKNEKVSEKYKIEAFPTILLTDTKGEVFARTTGYRPGGPTGYMTFLNTLLDGKEKRDMYLAKAKSAEGVERAKLLDQAMSIKDIMVPAPMKMIQEIMLLDSENEAGLKAKYELRIATQEAEKKIRDVGMALQSNDTATALEIIAAVEAKGLEAGPIKDQFDFMKAIAMTKDGRRDEAMKMLDAKIAGMKNPTPDELQQAMMGKFQVAMESKDVDLMNKVLDEMIAVAPDSEMSKAITMQRASIIGRIEAQNASKDAAEKAGSEAGSDKGSDAGSTTGSGG